MRSDICCCSGAYSLLEDERAVLIDIRPKGEAGKAGSPDLREFKGKRIVPLPFDYEVGFVLHVLASG